MWNFRIFCLHCASQSKTQVVPQMLIVNTVEVRGFRTISFSFAMYGGGKRGKKWFRAPGSITIKSPYKETNWLLMLLIVYAAYMVIQLNIPGPWIGFTG